MLLDPRGGQFELDNYAAWPVAALVDAGGSVAGVLHISEAGSPRLDVFDSRGRRRVILRRDGRMPLAIFLDTKERPRLRLWPSRAELLDARGKLVSAEPAGESGLAVLAGSRVVAVARERGIQLGPDDRIARLAAADSSWTLSVGNNRLALLDVQHSRQQLPHIGPLYGLAAPSSSRYRFLAEHDEPRAAPVLPWEPPPPLEFDDGGPTGADAAPGQLRLTNAR